MSILDQYVASAPSPQNALDIFEGEWSSEFPEPLDKLQAGTVPLFKDARIEWVAEQVDGLAAKTVLELGPLEGGHSYMLERLGADSIIAIEANTHAYLKCLITKELLGLQHVRFLHGDFVEFLRNSQESFDICIASGVLYHMRNPCELIALMSKACSQLFIWTHYYDEAIISASSSLAHKFSDHVLTEYSGFQHILYRQNYNEALNWAGFCGGSAEYSYWMSRNGIISCCKYFGFSEVRTHFENPHHPNGPSFALLAKKDTLFSKSIPLQKQESLDLSPLVLRLKQAQNQLRQLEAEMGILKGELDNEQNRIADMKTSRF
ncbi:MAG: class I SAM-dependent methyltransferase [Cyanobacteria bacterium CRU_2_1]|nr:class I SAM-dependent methyltransferase [Cyanobacteria bacterium CRU_2_1]